MKTALQVIRTSAVILMCGALALISSMSAFGQSFGRVIPETALRMWPSNGSILASVSTIKVARAAIAEKKERPTVIPQAAVLLARRAIVIEPTAVSAVRNIAYDLKDKGDISRARALMLAASRLSKRNTGVNLWLTEDFARQGREIEALRYYDVIMRSSSAAATALLPVMARVLRSPGAVAPFETLLADNPPWHDDFWTAVLSADDDLVNSVELRLRLHSAKVPLAASHDALLIRRMAEEGRLSDAFKLYTTAGGILPTVTGELIRNESFGRPTKFSPIDWKVVTDGAFGAMIDEQSGQLSISSLPDVGGVVAQQLIRIEKGLYRLTVEYSDPSATQENPLLARLVCAELSGEKTLSRIFRIGQAGSQSVQLETPCSFAWLSIELDADRNTGGVDTKLSRISLRRETR